MRLAIVQCLFLCLQIVGASWISLHCNPSNKVKVKFHFDSELEKGCVLSKELAEFLEVQVNNDGRNLYSFTSSQRVRVYLQSEKKKILKQEFDKIAVDNFAKGLTVWIPFNETQREIVDDGATGVHVNDFKNFEGKYVRRFFSRKKFKAYNLIFGPLVEGPVTKADIIHLTTRRSLVNGLSHDHRLRLVHELIRFRLTIADNHMRDVMVVCIYILFKKALNFTTEKCGITGDHVFAAMAAIVEMLYVDTFAIFGRHKELWSMLTLEQKDLLGQKVQYWTSSSLAFNDFFFKKFTCEGKILLQNMAYALRSPDDIQTQEHMRIISNLMEHYAEMVDHKLVDEDIPFIADVLRKSSNLTLKASYTHILGWDGPFLWFFKHLKVFWPFVLNSTDPNLWTYSLDLSIPDEAPRLRDTIHFFVGFYQAFSDPDDEESIILNWVTENLDDYKELTRDIFYETIEFFLYLSDFMILHSEARDRFYHKIAGYILKLIEYKKDDFDDTISVIRFLSEFGLNRLLHILLEETSICDEIVEKYSDQQMLLLFNSVTCDARCFMVLLDHLQPPPYFINLFRSVYTVGPYSAMDAVLAVYQSETRLNVVSPELAEVEWNIPKILLDTDKIEQTTQTLALQLFLYKDVFISLDMSMITHASDEEVPCTDYEMILNFVTERYMKLHQSTKRILITIPAVRDLELASLIDPPVEQR